MAKRIDDSHQPFKRKRTLGPGPKRHPKVTETKSMICRKGKNTKTHYVQVCKVVNTGATRTYKLKKSKKKAYNKIYRAWLKRVGATKGGARSGYRCHRTKSTRCK